jgi:hypothetical protein
MAALAAGTWKPEPEDLNAYLASEYGSRFWRQQGYPGLAGKYYAVNIPKGEQIASATETDSGLVVQYKNPTFDYLLLTAKTSPSALTGLSSLFIGLSSEQQEYLKSVAFWTQQGKSEYAGLYAPVNVKAGFTIKDIVGGNVEYELTDLAAAVRAGNVKVPTGYSLVGNEFQLSDPMAAFQAGTWQPTGEDLNTYLASKASAKWWMEHGHKEFAGQYGIPEVPKGWAISSISDVEVSGKLQPQVDIYLLSGQAALAAGNITKEQFNQWWDMKMAEGLAQNPSLLSTSFGQAFTERVFPAPTGYNLSSVGVGAGGALEATFTSIVQATQVETLPAGSAYEAGLAKYQAWRKAGGDYHVPRVIGYGEGTKELFNQGLDVDIVSEKFMPEGLVVTSKASRPSLAESLGEKYGLAGEVLGGFGGQAVEPILQAVGLEPGTRPPPAVVLGYGQEYLASHPAYAVGAYGGAIATALATSLGIEAITGKVSGYVTERYQMYVEAKQVENYGEVGSEKWLQSIQKDIVTDPVTGEVTYRGFAAKQAAGLPPQIASLPFGTEKSLPNILASVGEEGAVEALDFEWSLGMTPKTTMFSVAKLANPAYVRPSLPIYQFIGGELVNVSAIFTSETFSSEKFGGFQQTEATRTVDIGTEFEKLGFENVISPKETPFNPQGFKELGMGYSGSLYERLYIKASNVVSEVRDVLADTESAYRVEQILKTPSYGFMETSVQGVPAGVSLLSTRLAGVKEASYAYTGAVLPSVISYAGTKEQKKYITEQSKAYAAPSRIVVDRKLASEFAFPTGLGSFPFIPDVTMQRSGRQLGVKQADLEEYAAETLSALMSASEGRGRFEELMTVPEVIRTKRTYSDLVVKSVPDVGKINRADIRQDIVPIVIPIIGPSYGSAEESVVDTMATPASLVKQVPKLVQTYKQEATFVQRYEQTFTPPSWIPDMPRLSGSPVGGFGKPPKGFGLGRYRKVYPILTAEQYGSILFGWGGGGRGKAKYRRKPKGKGRKRK